MIKDYRHTMLRSVASLALLVGGLAIAHAQTPPTNLSCSWGIVSNANSLNIAYPDAFATYWTQPMALQQVRLSVWVRAEDGLAPFIFPRR